MFVYTPPISNIESLSQSNISSLDSVSFGRNRADVNIQQQTTSALPNTETVMTDNEELDPPPPQDTFNVFAAVGLSSHSSYDSDKYKRTWLKSKVIRSSILSAGEFTDACSRSLSVPINYNGIASIMEVTGAILPKQCANEITRHEQKKKILSNATSVGNKQK